MQFTFRFLSEIKLKFISQLHLCKLFKSFYHGYNYPPFNHNVPATITLKGVLAKCKEQKNSLQKA